MGDVVMFLGMCLMIFITIIYTIEEGIKADEKGDVRYSKIWEMRFFTILLLCMINMAVGLFKLFS